MWGKKEWLIFLVAFAFFALFTRTLTISPNDASRMGPVEGIVDHGTFSIDQSHFNSTMDRVFINGHYYSDKPMMSYLIFVPFYFALSKRGINFVTNHGLTYYVLTLFTLGVSVAAMLAFFFRLLKRYKLPTKTRLFYTAALGLCTLMLPYALAVNNHALTGAFLLMSYYFLVTAETPAHYAFAGLLAGLTATFEIAIGPIFLVLFTIFLFLKKRFARMAWYVAGAALPVIAYLVINYAISGSIIPFSIRPELFKYPGSAFSGGPGSASLSGTVSRPLAATLDYAWNVLFGWRGFFTYMPVLLFSAVGLLFAACKKGKFRHEAIVVTFGILLSILFYVTKTDNYGGCGYGFRFLVPLIPILFVFTPFLFQQKQAGFELKVLFVIALAFSFVVAWMGVSMHMWTCNNQMLPPYTLRQVLQGINGALSYHYIL